MSRTQNPQYDKRKIVAAGVAAIGMIASVITILVYLKNDKPASVHQETHGNDSPAISAGGNVQH